VALRWVRKGGDVSYEIGNMLSVSGTLYNLALAAHSQDDHERAAELYAEGLRSSFATDDKAHIAYCLEGLAQMAAAYGETERAAQMFGSAEAALKAAGGAVYVYVQDRSMHDQMVQTVRSRLDETTFSTAWAKGAAMSLSEAVEHALYIEEPTPTASSAVGGSHHTSARPGALTPRKQEAARFVASGLTNRQIASELSISEHTVATHVSKIMRKLELSSRSQLAAWVAEQHGSPSLDSG
jgi:DNA-binding NarL/FixJ family response regulator